MKIFVAEVGGIAVSACSFKNIKAARSYFNEATLRTRWESDPLRPKLATGLIVREATQEEAEVWREGRANSMKGLSVMGLPSNPEVLFISNGGKT